MDAVLFIFELYGCLALTLTIYSFCLCGVPEIERRGVLRNRYAPAYQHAIAAVCVAVLMGLMWPWVFWGSWRKAQ